MAPSAPAVALALALSAPLPPGPEVIVLSQIPGKLGPVTFTHLRHATAYRMPDGARIGCRDCHHNLASEDAPVPPPGLRCTACHAPLGQPEREIGGKPARTLARLKPDGAIDVRSVLLHDQCRGCHLRIPAGALNLATCKVCHPRGLAPDAIHGRYDAR